MTSNVTKNMYGPKINPNQYPQPPNYMNQINNSSNKEQVISQIRNLNQNERQEVINTILNENNFQTYSMPKNNYDPYLEVEMKQEKMEFENEEKLLAMKQLDEQLLRQSLDYRDCWDFYFSAIATIENLALGNSPKKEYGKYDEFDACSFKDKNQLIIQLLKILKNFQGAFEDYLNDYKGVIDYPEDIDITLKQIEDWKKKINNKEINKYLDELINILNQKSKMDFQKELNKYYSKEKIEKEEMQKGFQNAMLASSHVRKEESESKKQFEEKGDLPKYKVERGVPAGRFKNKNKANQNNNFKKHNE